MKNLKILTQNESEENTQFFKVVREKITINEYECACVCMHWTPGESEKIPSPC